MDEQHLAIGELPSADIQAKPTFERMGEYTAVLDNLAGESARRQSTNNLFMGLNTVFIGAVGILCASFRLSSWWGVVAISAVAFLSMLLNVTWLLALKRYRLFLDFRYDYLRQIEEEFRARRVNDYPRWDGDPTRPIGLFLGLKDAKLNKRGNTSIEMWLPVGFIVFYPVVAVVAAVVTWFVLEGIIPALIVR